MLIVYVDDFKPAARIGEHDAIWNSIRKVIDMDPETADGRFLGCSHERFTTSAKQVHVVLGNHPGYNPRQKQGAQLRRRAGPLLLSGPSPRSTTLARRLRSSCTIWSGSLRVV